MSLIKWEEWPVLQAKARTGKVKYWQIRVLYEAGLCNGLAQIEVEWWQQGSVHQTQSREVEGKNIGRLNETSSLMQALAEAESEFKKQQDKGYSQTGQPDSPYTLPMLAQDFKSKKHKIQFPCYGQPKLDGVRCLYNPALGFWSRQGKPFTAVNLDHLRWDAIEYITLDGELILPPPYTFQQTVSAIKKQNELTPLLEYHVFDMVTEGPFRSRYHSLKMIHIHQVINKTSKVTLVETVSLQDMSSVEGMLQTYLTEGYEGLILRNASGEYEIGQRSNDLQKFKEFQDSEYQIVGVMDGVGKEKGAAIFACHTSEGRVFHVRPAGDYESRRQMFTNRDQYVGQWLNVRFQNMTDDNVPRFPVGRGIREMVDGKVL